MRELLGHIQVYKKYQDKQEKVYEALNTISDGMAYSLVNLFTSQGSFTLEDYQVGYFQLGTGSLSGYLPSQTHNRNFYELANKLPASSYGSSSIQGVTILNQVINTNGNFNDTVSYSTASGAFIEILDNQVVQTNDGGFQVLVTIDENLANGVLLNEIGLFSKNPKGLPTVDEPVLLAYKSLPPILKDSNFSIIINWKIFIYNTTVNDEPTQSIFGQGGSRRVTVDFVSGVDTTSNKGTLDDFSDRFEILIPSSYNPLSNPLIVAFHGLGNNMTQWRNDNENDQLIPKIREREWFYVAPLGRSTIDINDNNTTSLYPHSTCIISNWNSNNALEHTKRVVQYVIDNYPIDKNRIYFLGHSAGGGCALNFAGRLLDPSPSAWQPAAVISNAGALNAKLTWANYAPATATAPTLWPTPLNGVLRDSGEVMAFWTGGQGDIDYVPGSNLAGWGQSIQTGPSWSTVSALTPSDIPFYYFELNSIDYSLITSTLSLSTCVALNLRHIPIYLTFMLDDDQAPHDDITSALLYNNFISEPNIILSGLLTTSSYGYQYKIAPSGTDAFYATHVSATSNHSTSALDIDDALNFVASASLTMPTEASTVCTRTGRYWYFHINTVLDINYASSSISSSGLSMLLWSINRETNTLYVSGSKNMWETNGRPISFYPDLAGFSTATQNNPLKVYNLSGHPNFPIEATSPGNRRLQIEGYANPYQIKWYDQPSYGTISSSGTVCSLNGVNWQTSPGVTVAANVLTGGLNDLQLRRTGYFEIIKTYDPE